MRSIQNNIIQFWKISLTISVLSIARCEWLNVISLNGSLVRNFDKHRIPSHKNDRKEKLARIVYHIALFLDAFVPSKLFVQ